MRIALVDQSRTIVRIVTDLIQADGHEVLGFTDPRSALAELGADSEIRALVTSIQLESLSGIELCAAARERLPLSAIILDVDEFKRVNDTYGHFTGDRAIAAVAAQLKRCGAVIGRLGGEEFCLLIEGDLAQAFALAEELRNAVMDIRVM